MSCTATYDNSCLDRYLWVTSSSLCFFFKVGGFAGKRYGIQPQKLDPLSYWISSWVVFIIYRYVEPGDVLYFGAETTLQNKAEIPIKTGVIKGFQVYIYIHRHMFKDVFHLVFQDPTCIICVVISIFVRFARRLGIQTPHDLIITYTLQKSCNTKSNIIIVRNMLLSLHVCRYTCKNIHTKVYI